MFFFQILLFGVNARAVESQASLYGFEKKIKLPKYYAVIELRLGYSQPHI